MLLDNVKNVLKVSFIERIGFRNKKKETILQEQGALYTKQNQDKILKTLETR